MGRAFWIAVGVSTAWLPSACAAAAPLASLTLTETAGVARRDAPTVVGVPFARGALAAPGDDVVFDAAHGRVLERWPDGSVRWLLVDLSTSLPAGARGTRTLVARRGATIRAATRASNEADGVRAESTGVLVLTAPAHGPTLARVQPAGGAPALALPWPTLRLDGTSLPSPVVDRVQVETSDLLQSELLVQARQPEGLRHEVRLALFAGHPWVRVRYTLTNMGEARYLHVRAFSFTIPWTSRRGELGIDGVARPFDFVPPRRRHAVVQRDGGSSILDGQETGRHADGTARVYGGGRALSVAVPWFWEEYPKALAVSSEGIEIDLAAAAADDPLLFGVGAAKTWEFWLAVDPEPQAPPLASLARAMTTPPLVFVPPERVADSGALPYAIAPDEPGAITFLRTLRKEIDQYRARATAERWDDGPPGACTTRHELHAHVGFYGALNWGDWNFPGFRDGTKGCDAWGNLEYDLPLVLGLAYLATGEPEIWTLFENAARHYRDVDIIHHWPGHSDRVGLNHPHKVRHFATDAPSTVDLGHVWLDGLLLHHRLTGEVRSRRAVTRMADALAALTSRGRNPRQLGWPMIALAAAFEATGEARYRDACLTFAARAAREFPPNPNAEWKMGILAEGMMAAHRATGDAGVRHWLDEYGQKLLVPPPAPRDPRLVVPAGYLYELTGDARYAELARTTASHLAPGNWGKSLASVGRIGFALLAPLARPPGEARRGPAAPPPASAPGSPRSSPRPGDPSPPSDR